MRGDGWFNRGPDPYLFPKGVPNLMVQGVTLTYRVSVNGVGVSDPQSKGGPSVTSDVG